MAPARRPPGPKGHPFTGVLPEFRDDPLSFLLGAVRDYGDVVHFKIGPRNYFLLNHPDYIKDVLVTNHRNFRKSLGMRRSKYLLGEGLLTSEGEFHRRHRHLAQPAFHRKRIETYASVMSEYSVRHMRRWHGGETRNIAQDMMHLALAIVSKTLYDADMEVEADEIGAALTACLQASQRSPAWLFKITPIRAAKILDRLPLPANQRFRRARARLDSTIYRIIAERRGGGDRGDLLSMLLSASDVDQDGEQMSDKQLRDEAITIFLAGHETTANALAWTWYLLSQHPEVEAQLLAELDTVLGGRLPTVDDIPHLKYTEMVIHESMRLYPPIWLIPRQVLDAFEVGGYQVPANSNLMLSPYVMHHDPRYYEEPFRFDPLRWTPEARAERPKFSYFPFGGGPRQCIGESFAWMEAIVVISTLAQHWRMRLAPGHIVEPQPIVTLRPRHGLYMMLEERASMQDMQVVGTVDPVER